MGVRFEHAYAHARMHERRDDAPGGRCAAHMIATLAMLVTGVRDASPPAGPQFLPEHAITGACRRGLCDDRERGGLGIRLRIADVAPWLRLSGGGTCGAERLSPVVLRVLALLSWHPAGTWTGARLGAGRPLSRLGVPCRRGAIRFRQSLPR